ncbi:MAG: hypothetical protein ACK6DZ_10260 [Acidobacteriota bacterium]
MISNGKQADVKVAKIICFAVGAMLLFDRGCKDHEWFGGLTWGKRALRGKPEGESVFCRLRVVLRGVDGVVKAVRFLRQSAFVNKDNGSACFSGFF